MYPTRLLQPRSTTRRTTEGTMASYVHAAGRVGVLVEVNCETQGCAKSVELMLFARWIAEHIAAAAPIAVERDQLPAELVARRHRAFVADALADCRSEADESAAGLDVERRMEALYRDLVLMEQPWNRNRSITVGLLTAQVSALSGECVRVRRFSRFHMGLA
jgi:elongation factor Ts